MATAAGIATVIASGLEPGVARARVGGRARRHALPAAPVRHSSFKLWLKYAKPSHGTLTSTPAPRARCARAARRCCRSASSTSTGASTPATRSRSRRPAAADRQGHLQLLRRRAAPGDGAEVGPGARGAAARDRGGRPPRLLRAGLSARRSLVAHGRRRPAPSPTSAAPRKAAARGAGATRLGGQGRGAARDRRRAEARTPRDPRGQRARPRGRAASRPVRRADGPARLDARARRGDRRRRARDRRAARPGRRGDRRLPAARTGSTCARCACRSASSPSSTRRGRTSRSTPPRCA